MIIPKAGNGLERLLGSQEAYWKTLRVTGMVVAHGSHVSPPLAACKPMRRH
jgi:hypothetical protein